MTSAARVDLGKHPDDELAELGRALNAMAGELEVARHGERQFLLSVSHDLRTPLTSIRGYADALTDGTIPATDEQRRAGAVIAAEADRLERLVADLLDLARIDAHQFSLSPRPFDVATTVRTAVEAFLPAAADLGIELVADDARRSWPRSVIRTASRRSSPTSWRTRSKYARPRITVTVGADGLHEVAIRVVDDGPGIDPGEEQPRLRAALRVADRAGAQRRDRPRARDRGRARRPRWAGRAVVEPADGDRRDVRGPAPAPGLTESRCSSRWNTTTAVTASARRPSSAGR